MSFNKVCDFSLHINACSISLYRELLHSLESHAVLRCVEVL